MTFLIVADDADFVTGVQEALENRRHGCLTARDVDEASWTVKLAKVDAVALDIDPSEDRALEWLAELSLTRKSLAGNCVLLASAPLHERLLMQATACGARVLEKPVATADLMDALVERAGRRRRGARAANGDPDAGPPPIDLDPEH